METEEKPEEKPEETPSADKSFARIASGVSEIRMYIFLILLLVMFNQCSGLLKPESEEAKALWSIDHSLRTIHEDLKSLGQDDSGGAAALRGISRSLSEINGSIWNKSCPR